jgi:S-adenosylmethionine hydrolase
MKTNGIITLLTDFGLADAYVGVMKGVMLHINPALHCVDLTHQVPPQDIATGAFQLQMAYPYFPQGTVHLAVVDPGVGSYRRAIALATDFGYCVGPDNGLFSRILQGRPANIAIELDQSKFWRIANPSVTFHGRDIFAPVAAHIASGIDLNQMGTRIALDSLQQLPPLGYQQTETGFSGHIQAIDHFGNLITSIPQDCILPPHWTVYWANIAFPSGSHYGDAGVGQPVSVRGSHGWIELALMGGNAAQQFEIHIGDRIELQLKE